MEEKATDVTLEEEVVPTTIKVKNTISSLNQKVHTANSSRTYQKHIFHLDKQNIRIILASVLGLW